MIAELSPVFTRYLALRAEADAVFKRMSLDYPENIKCRRGCSDCCHALFDLSLVEAMYINDAFEKAFAHGPQRSAILERASDIDRDLTRLKREMFRAEKGGEDAREIMAKVANVKIPCPLLGEDDACLLYESRPIICRLYGIPLDIGGSAHVCGLTGFVRGKNYPAVRLAKIQASLENLSHEIAEIVGSRFELESVYVPVSMALLTRYDDKYLGIGEQKEEDD